MFAILLVGKNINPALYTRNMGMHKMTMHEPWGTKFAVPELLCNPGHAVHVDQYTGQPNACISKETFHLQSVHSSWDPAPVKPPAYALPQN